MRQSAQMKLETPRLHLLQPKSNLMITQSPVSCHTGERIGSHLSKSLAKKIRNINLDQQSTKRTMKTKVSKFLNLIFR
jgi:hypothetical protein